MEAFLIGFSAVLAIEGVVRLGPPFLAGIVSLVART